MMNKCIVQLYSSRQKPDLREDLDIYLDEVLQTNHSSPNCQSLEIMTAPENVDPMGSKEMFGTL